MQISRPRADNPDRTPCCCRGVFVQECLREESTMALSLSAAPQEALGADTLAEMQRIRWWHRIPVGRDAEGRPVYTPGEVRHGPDGGDWPTTRFGLPADLTGKTVLDIGAWDGFFSFEAERRGAERVLAVDVSLEQGGNWGGTRGFRFAHQLLNSQVEFQPVSIYDLDPVVLGQFDVSASASCTTSRTRCGPWRRWPP